MVLCLEGVTEFHPALKKKISWIRGGSDHREINTKRRLTLHQCDCVTSDLPQSMRMFISRSQCLLQLCQSIIKSNASQQNLRKVEEKLSVSVSCLVVCPLWLALSWRTYCRLNSLTSWRKRCPCVKPPALFVKSASVVRVWMGPSTLTTQITMLQMCSSESRTTSPFSYSHTTLLETGGLSTSEW